MFDHKTLGTVVFAALTLVGGHAAADVDYTKMSPHELAEYLLFEAGGFKLDTEVQEGGTARQRLVQDELHKLCSETRNRPSVEQAAEISLAARESVKYPGGDIQLGDWEKGRQLAWSGFGYRVGERTDDHTKGEPGGACYNCHEFAGDRQGGTIGPSLRNYGKLRGTEQPVLKLAYGIIYNPHSMFPCTRMPRQGANGLLTEQQILDLLAYLFDPESPVNKE
ncbi:sulfur oxidation c-type cytochrome SoxX [Thioalkalicoccus limnaeus]|uniref:Sulfur oxidation c-type cytochrome SoxX n=1 Tax=Thioalkalicoccus limnaeus TaxID=120681 RepID=A0ABV4BEJ0_9GAMM